MIYLGRLQHYTQILCYPEKLFRKTNALAYFYHKEKDPFYKFATYSANSSGAGTIDLFTEVNESVL